MIPSVLIPVSVCPFSWLCGRRYGEAQKNRCQPKQSALLAGDLQSPAFLYEENHSQGEWFKRRLMPMM